jgi:hypothetical protein
VTLEGLGVAVEAIVPGGANGVTAFAVSSESDGLRVDTRTVSSNGEPIRTFGDHVDANLIEHLPAETQIAVSGSDFANTRLVDAALSIVFSILSSSFVSMSDQADSGATPEALPTGLDDSAAGAYALASAFLGVDLQSNLVDLLDGEFLFGLWNTGGQYSDPSFGFISESSDAATIDRTISTLTLAVTLLFGASTSTSPSGAIVIDLDGGSVEIDVIDDSLVIGYGGGGETLLETPESGLVDTELFQTVTEPLPADRSILIFVNVQALQDGAPPPRVPGPFGLSRSSADGPAFAFVMFNDGDEMGGQGYLYIPEP